MSTAPRLAALVRAVYHRAVQLAHVVAALAGLVLIVVIVWDAFESMILPRRVTRRFRPTRLFYRVTWYPWRAVARRFRRRETYLAYYGPLSLLGLIGGWAIMLIVSFALVHWALGTSFGAERGALPFGSALYMSGTTFFTLGLGDIVPRGPLARAVTVVECGVGFLFLATIVAYLPILYQAFSRREVAISLLDARAGSPPSATELLCRHAHDPQALVDLLRDWERWAAELLESHISYPVLSHFRSQHDNQSWLGALTAILDASAIEMAGGRGHPARQAELTFAMARHAVVDLAQVLGTPPSAMETDRLSPHVLLRVVDRLSTHGVVIDAGDGFDARLAELRAMYEPYVNALAGYLLTTIPPWISDAEVEDAWERTAFNHRPERPARSQREIRGHDDD